MKLIIERLDDQFFAYVEKENIFQINEPHRGFRVAHIELDNECILDLALYNGEYMVFNLKEAQGKYKTSNNFGRNSK